MNGLCRAIEAENGAEKGEALDRLRSVVKLGDLKALESVRESLVSRVRAKDVVVIRFIRNLLAQGEDLRAVLAECGLEKAAAVHLSCSDEVAKLLNNFAATSESRSEAVWTAVGRERLIACLERKSAPVLAMVLACIAASQRIMNKFSRDSELLSAALSCYQASDECDTWTMVIVRRMVLDGQIESVLTALRDVSDSRELFFSVLNVCLEGDVEEKAPMVLSLEDLVRISSPELRSSTAPILCLGSAALAGAIVDNVMDVVRAGLQSSNAGAKSAALRLLAFSLSADPKTQQEKALEAGVVPLVLSAMGVESKNPMMREWAVFCVRSLCDNNERIQAEISSYELKEAHQSSMLEDAGLEPYVTDEGKLKIRKLASDA
mmetsp:Transcript_4814/g.14509  ORF Transcript_4814/g.14509 Transcript_4814/m.14509 type:complete len:377 (-) Transcript_4814:955-2085(-)|eukprot:CAMPEP_0198724506 /NCGR_PEP_ID=MMETSP1475-20131203/1964_1 /TAXON_ID= ORGANISM="Unidentified sp., Strain CCMP1999" /NCGR_SAMPLE_ID=MMETSP1475 /ASSEMBLY_ACC=CAM_ASM_001111 /LENGTH=376 /DNA_ID=CAMNT_0044486047 /DNA_START=15 /DNA_END=1145 /DNA_ORIENTATION=-